MNNNNDLIKCLICGKAFKKPCLHVAQAHKIKARDYRTMFGLDVKRGIISEEKRKILRDHVFNNGTVNNLKKGQKHRFKKGQENIGKYKRSKQTLERLNNNLHRMNRA